MLYMLLINAYTTPYKCGRSFWVPWVRISFVTCVTQETFSGLIGVATDGASSNVVANGLRGLVQEKLPWIVWVWCLAQLAISDTLSGTSCFKLLDDMLLRLYYLYQKSPKKCRELTNIVSDLKEVFVIDDQGGSRPIRACGTWWVYHKGYEKSYGQIWSIYFSPLHFIWRFISKICRPQ